MDITSKIPREVLALTDRLASRGFNSWLVGGCLRDIVRGAVPRDWDVATAARPEIVMEMFERALPTGVAHGTVTVITGGVRAEVTTCRTEGEYREFRRPGAVEFTASIFDDLARRDFTMNAMAWNRADGLLDPYGGAGDLAAGILRCVRDPRARIGEDALRIMRALRFAATLSLGVEETLSAALREKAPLLRMIAAERVWAELTGLLAGARAGRVLCEFDEIIQIVLPGAAPDGTGARPGDPAVRLAWLLRRLAPEEAAERVRKLRGDGKTARRVEDMLRHAGRGVENLPVLLRLAGEETARDLLAFHAKDPGEIDAIIRSGLCWSVRQLAVSGDDLIAEGMPPGREVGAALEALLDAVMDGRCANRREDLLILSLFRKRESINEKTL